MYIVQALAIIRQKPKGMSVREFIGRLKVITSDCQVDWKAKVLSVLLYRNVLCILLQLLSLKTTLKNVTI